VAKINPNHPLVKSLRRLPTRVRKQFLRWLESELYTSRKNLASRCLHVLAFIDQKTYPAPASPPPTPLHLTYLRRELDVFLSIRHFLADDTSKTRAVIGAHLELKDNARATRLKEKRIGAISASQELEHYYERSLLDEEILTIQVPGSEVQYQTILRINEHNDRIFLLSKLQQACRLVSHKILRATEANLPYMEDALRIIEEDPRWMRDPLIPLYYHAYRALTFDSGEDFTKLFDLLSSQKQEFNNNDLRDLFITLLNTSIKKMNKGEAGFDRYVLSLYQLGLRESVILIGGKLSGSSYLNITVICLKLKQDKWLGEFLPEYRPRLSPRDQTTYYPYCLAIRAYERQEILQADDHLGRFEFAASAAVLQLHVRILQTKIYYDQGELDLLDSHLNSFSVFLSRHQELGYYREIVLAFVRLCHRMLMLPPNISAAQRLKLKKDITKISVASYREWLLARLR